MTTEPPPTPEPAAVTPSSVPALLPSPRERLLAIIREKSLIRGLVTLASGRVSGHYFDMKPTMFDPEGADLLAQLMVERLALFEVDLVGGLEMGAVPLITPIAIASRKAGRPVSGFFVRKSVKDHGTKKLIDGVGDVTGKRVAIVEDVTTTGGSAMKAVTALRAAGATVSVVMSIVDREDGAGALFEAADIPFRPLFAAEDFRS